MEIDKNYLYKIIKELSLDFTPKSLSKGFNNTLILGTASADTINEMHSFLNADNPNCKISIIANPSLLDEIDSFDFYFKTKFEYSHTGIFDWQTDPDWWMTILDNNFDSIFCPIEQSNIYCISNIIEILFNSKVKSDLYIYSKYKLVHLIPYKTIDLIFNKINTIDRYLDNNKESYSKKLFSDLNRIKIIYDCRTLNTKNYTGIPRYSSELLYYLSLVQSEHNLKLYAIGCENEKIPNDIEFIPIPLSLSDHKRSNRLLNLSLNCERPSLVFSPYYPIPSYKLCKGILTIHDLIPLRYPEWFSNPTTLNFFKNDLFKSALSADRIIAVSIATKNDIQEFYGIDENKISVVYSAPSQVFQSESLTQKRCKIPNKFTKKPYFLSVATVEPRKNLIGVIKAFEIFRDTEKTIDANLILVGKFGWNKKAVLEARNACKYRESIIFTGFIEDQVLIKLYQNTLAFVYVSLHEGFGFPVLEAMCCGAPVITSNNSSLREIAMGSSILCNPYDISEIANAMGRIIADNSLRKDVIQKGYLNVKKFTWSKTVLETINVFKYCLY